MIPNKRNFCGGNFQDWLEVNLTSECNGRCSWCVERTGYKPDAVATWQELCQAALSTEKLNIILLGGEPTLYPDLYPLSCALSAAGRRVWITTNGSMLTPQYVRDNLRNITGINISVHHYDLGRNATITGVELDKATLKDSLITLHQDTYAQVSVRLNCNCIAGQIDSQREIVSYVEFAKGILADKIRFAELRNDDTGFVDLAALFLHEHGLNDDPFAEGCNSDAVVWGMPVNFRQMCGLQTSRRARPEDPQQALKQVLYYDGKLYDGWQTAGKEDDVMEPRDLKELLQKVADGEISADAAIEVIRFFDRKHITPKAAETQRPDKTPPARRDLNVGCCY